VKQQAPDPKALKELCAAVALLRDARECEAFLTDLCTPAELSDMADRWRVARLLDEGLPYREIHDRTGVSTATVTRVARWLLSEDGGYRRVLERLKPKRGPNGR